MKHLVHNLIILDESGSMADIRKQTINGFNETIQNMKGIQAEFPDQEHLVTFLTFNSLTMRTHLLEEKVELLQPINDDNYQPNAFTPLYDAIGYSINRLKRSLEGKTGYNVLVTILTDGEENASKEYNGNNIKNLVEDLTKQNWTFTYLGTDHNVDRAASKISIVNRVVFSKTQISLLEMFKEDATSRRHYAQRIRNKEDANSQEFFDKKNWKNIK